MNLKDVEKKEIMGVNIDSLTLAQSEELIINSIKKGEDIHHVVVNAGKMVAMKKDKALFDSIVNCNMINADGQAVVWASRFLSKPLPERVAGIDLMVRLVERAAKEKMKINLFGAKEDVVKKLSNIYKDKYGESIIAGYRNGYFNKDEEANIVKEIAKSVASMLFVAMSSPKKENFLREHSKELKIPFIMGVGGAFDLLSHTKVRAPIWVQKAGLEWLYRMLQEPGRMWKRYLFGNTKFVYYILKEKLKGR